MAQSSSVKNEFNNNDINDSVQIAQHAADGDSAARAKISQITHPIITYQTRQFCKRFCYENSYRYACTLEKPIGNPPRDASLCEWGNGSYGWMLDDLTNENRLRKFRGENGARINDYLYHIANSLPFYERWKDWRFSRKVHVPTYIQDLSPYASRVFLNLRSGTSILLIAQQLGLSEIKAETTAQQIIIELTQRGKLHLLDPPSTVSLSSPSKQPDDEFSEAAQNDVATEDLDFEIIDSNEKLHQAWSQLDTIEQYVLEAMVIENQEAEDILSALVALNVSINNKPAAQLDRQQLYYFRRKTLAKLEKLLS